MRVADWIADYLYSIGVQRVHGLMGGGAAGLNDGFIKHGKIEYICYHNEQGAGHAALGEAKYTGELAVVNPTTGCGGTNCATSVLNAWQDGVPILFLSGNVKRDNCTTWLRETKFLNLRHYGTQEHDVVATMRSMTKVARFIGYPEEVPEILQRAIGDAQFGRKGPVWIDIPSDIQTAQMPEYEQRYLAREYLMFTGKYKLTDTLNKAQRPLVVVGTGVRMSGEVERFMKFVEQFKIPFVTTYGAQDYAPYTHPLNIGTPGVRGNRAGNFAMQNADLLLFLGTSLGAPVVGYDPAQFNPTAYKIYVDIEFSELHKDIIPIDWKIETTLDSFFRGML